MPEVIDPYADAAAVARAIGAEIRARRLALDLTLDNLGRRAGLSKGFLSLVESRERGVGVHSLLRIARALEVPSGWFLMPIEDGTSREMMEATP